MRILEEWEAITGARIKGWRNTSLYGHLVVRLEALNADVRHLFQRKYRQRLMELCPTVCRPQNPLSPRSRVHRASNLQLRSNPFSAAPHPCDTDRVHTHASYFLSISSSLIGGSSKGSSLFGEHLLAPSPVMCLPHPFSPTSFARCNISDDHRVTHAFLPLQITRKLQASEYTLYRVIEFRVERVGVVRPFSCSLLASLSVADNIFRRSGTLILSIGV